MGSGWRGVEWSRRRSGVRGMSSRTQCTLVWSTSYGCDSGLHRGAGCLCAVLCVTVIWLVMCSAADYNDVLQVYYK